jgi:FkbM family methyltransferase
MKKKIVNGLLNKFNYDIIKLPAHGAKKFEVNSDVPGLSLYDTPTGKFYLPSALKNDSVANAIKSGYYFEQEIIDLAKEYYKPGTVLLDIGGNYGQMAVAFSKFSTGGYVYTFEAEPFVYAVLKRNIDINKCSNVNCIAGAVYNKAGEKLVFPEPDFKRFESYGSYGVDPTAKEGRIVETITIDSLQVKEPVSFIKVDIQGSDLFALQGARETILKNKPAIVFEFEQQFQDEFKTSFNDYVEFVRSINYRFDKVLMGINYLILPNE